MHFPESRAGTWSGGYPALQDRLEVKPPLQYSFNSTSLTLVQHIPCIIPIISFSDRWGLRSRCRALAKPRVHRPNRVSMTRMRVVAWSHVSPDNVMQQYRLGPPAVCNDTAIPDSWCCSSGRRASGNNPAPIPRPRLATPCVPVSFRLLVLMMTTKVVFLRGSACAFPVCAGTWPRDLLVPQSRLTRAEPRLCR